VLQVPAGVEQLHEVRHALDVPGALDDLGLQVAVEVRQLVHRGFELPDHAVEGVGQLPQLVVAADAHLHVEVALADGVRPGGELEDRPRQAPAHEDGQDQPQPEEPARQVDGPHEHLGLAHLGLPVTHGHPHVAHHAVRELALALAAVGRQHRAPFRHEDGRVVGVAVGPLHHHAEGFLRGEQLLDGLPFRGAGLAGAFLGAPEQARSVQPVDLRELHVGRRQETLRGPGQQSGLVGHDAQVGALGQGLAQGAPPLVSVQPHELRLAQVGKPEGHARGQ
jgi:hypothetical protein